ncbi:hypothetical protein FACS189426_16250 [Bacteroidia bacterium]|nr:hypothetical protein FACS189426_16250 [Bacteroidia bacterium]GHT84359.1 hypothetical protein FACS18947_1690 [Bacteroidia bacterium]
MYPTDKGQDNKQLAQSIINEMQVQGFFDGFIDGKTGEALVEIQFSGEKMNFKIDMQGDESFQK